MDKILTSLLEGNVRYKSQHLLKQIVTLLKAGGKSMTDLSDVISLSSSTI